ncbi:MAG: hypothetical protein Aurels2KO_23810 [Aureliella sp.]
MENKISAKLSQAEAYSNRSFVVQPAGAGSDTTANDLFEQFLVVPAHQRPAERPEKREPSGDDQPRDSTPESDRDSRVESDDSAPQSADTTVENNDSDEPIDPLLVTDSLIAQEPNAAPVQNADSPADVLDGNLDAAAVDASTHQQTIVQATDGNEQASIGELEQIDQSTELEPIATIEQAPDELTPQQVVVNEEGQIKTGQSQTSDETAASALQGEQQSNQQQQSGEQTGQSPTGEIRTTTSSDQQETSGEDHQGRQHEFESRAPTPVESVESQEAEAKWFQQPASNPLYSASQTSDAPISLPPVDPTTSHGNDHLPPGLEVPVEVATTTNEGENLGERPSGQGDQSGNSDANSSLPTQAAAAKAAVQTGLSSGATAAGTSIGSPTDSAAPVSNSAARPDTSSPARNAGPSATPGTPSAEGSDISQHERIRLIQRVSRSFSRLTPTGGEISLRLHPPQLGSLAVKVQMEGSSLSARMSTETEAAREIIVENLPVLRKRLAEQGIEVTQMHVDVSDGSSDSSLAGSGDSGTQDRQADQRSQQRVAQYRQAIAPRSAETFQATTVTTASASTSDWGPATSIDVHA